ncbi:Duplicated homeodomain-like superfamily protein [Hirschfeldia incana]|nr:Duplicated homeodomain-like superfamily protein [Hirschfeldia incana]KAJ0253542.1 Duplicated homeodomain-like superfamily protein [Hirschfeldia incana]
MPPQDHSSWDRKDLLRQRKHDRPSEPPFDPRWRDSPSSSSSSHHREFSRWGGSADFRRPSSHGKQSGRYQFAEESSHGYTSSRSSTRMFESDYYRPSAPPRGDWRYSRNCRDDRVPLSQKDLRCNTWEMNNGSSRAFDRPCGFRNGRRSVEERPPPASETHTTVVNSWEPANSAQQMDVELCTPTRAVRFKSEQKFSDQRQSLHSDLHSDGPGLFDRPSSVSSYENKECSPAKQTNGLMYGRRLADDSSLDPPVLNAEKEGTRNQILLKEDDKLHGVSDVDGVRENGKENSLGAIGKLPVWTRSGSFASQSSGFSHSSSLKSLGAVDSSDREHKSLPKTVAVTQSSSGDATVCAKTTLSEEMSSRKKQRLGWGEGLAKYENKKVDVNTTEDGTDLLENSAEEMHSLNKNIADKSPIEANAPDYGSPTTPSSVACNSSPDKSSAKAAIGASDVSNMCRSPSPVSSTHLERLPFNIEDLDNISTERVGCLLNELLGTDDPVIGDSSSVQLTSMHKLLAWKGDILKAVEMAESEIDLLESKQRALKLESGRQCRVVKHASEGDKNVQQEASCVLGLKSVASSVAETLVRDPVHQAVSAKIPVVIIEDRRREVNALPQFLAAVGSNGDILPIPSTKADANQETIDLCSADDSMVSDEEVLCAKLLSTNKIYATESSQVFDKLLPRDFSSFDDSRFPGICQRQFDSNVKEKIADRIELLRAREKILLLQFKAFQLAWKKEVRQLASAKYQPKANKKTEVFPYAKNGGHLKFSQPVRLRLSSSASRRYSVASTTELAGYMKKLLKNTRLKPFRDILRMPAMILDEKERARSQFISSNGLIEDPCDVEKERTMINPWTSEEKEIFLSMLAMHGKDFKKIASYLTQKTTADCIDYYYKNHKSDCFGKIKKQRGYGKEGKHTYMLAPTKKWKREMGAASLDILGAVSIIAANAGKVASTRQTSSKRITLRGCSSSSSLQRDGNYSEGYSHSFDFPRKRALGADVVAVGPLSSEQINSCLRTSVNSREGCMDHLKLAPAAKKPRISHTTHNENSNEDDDSCSEESCGETGPIHWTDAERSAFIQGFSQFGKNFASLSRFVRTRSPDQCRVFFSKVRKCLGLECIQSGSGNVSTSASVDNANEGGGSDLEGPCAMESNSGICNNGVSATIGLDGLDTHTSPVDMNQEGANHSGFENVEAGLSRSEQENGLALLRLKDCTNLVDAASIPGQVSEPCRDLVDINTVESRCQAADQMNSNDPLSKEIAEGNPTSVSEEKTKSNDQLSTEVDEGNLTPVAVSSDPLYCGSLVLSNSIVKKGSGCEGAALPNQSSKMQDGVMQAANRTINSGIEAEAAPSSFRYPECLHHVPIEEDLVGVVSVPQGDSNCHTESELPNPLVVQTNQMGWQFSDVNLDLDRRSQVMGHVKAEQNGQLNATSMESCQIPWISFTQDPSRIIRSKSDLILKAQRTGEAFSLRKCTSSASKPLTVFQKDGRSGHSRSHSFSLSDTERLDKNGDVKLFGTVLTADENGSKQKHNPGGSIRSFSTLSRDHEAGHQYINQQHLQNVPITSYGFWDGNRIQTGLTSLPESAKLLASLPETLATHHTQQVVSTKEIQLDVSGVLSFGKHIEDRTEVSSGKDKGKIGGEVNGVAEAAT